MIRPVILSGGSGTRLWPLSRRHMPKQFLTIASERSMLHDTAARVSGPLFAPVLVVGAEEHGDLIKQQLNSGGFAVDAILLEPFPRNTAAAAALAAEWCCTRFGPELLLILPSDHIILDLCALATAIEQAVPYAEQGHIVSFGILPDHPNVEYGYIEAAPVPAEHGRPIRRFVEKPDLVRAMQYVESGRFFWNAGIFLVKASALLDELTVYLPEGRAAVARALAGATLTDGFVRPDAQAFAQAPNISIDHAVMERTTRGIVVPVDMGWSDVGSWSAAWNLSPQDSDGNVVSGDVVVLDTRNSLLRSDGSATIAALGLDSMVVVAVDDAILVAPLDRAAEVRQLVEAMADRQPADPPARTAAALPLQDSPDLLVSAPDLRADRIELPPGKSLHPDVRDRSTHWIVTTGEVDATCSGAQTRLSQHQCLHVPAGEQVRLFNRSAVPAVALVVQSHPGSNEIA